MNPILVILLSTLKKFKFILLITLSPALLYSQKNDSIGNWPISLSFSPYDYTYRTVKKTSGEVDSHVEYKTANHYVRPVIYDVGYTIIGMGQTDSIPEKRLSIEIDVSPFTYSKWSFPENQYVTTVHPGETRDVSKRFNFFNLTGIKCFYSIKPNIIIGVGLNYLHENINAVGTYDTLENGNIKHLGFKFYDCNYIEIPLFFNWKISGKSKRKYSNIRIGANFDFIYYESSDYAHETITNSAGYGYYHEDLNGNKHTISNSFNRITPFLYVGREIYTERRKFSFSYGTIFIYKSIYQNHVTSEFYKNYKITPITTGVSYHF